MTGDAERRDAGWVDLPICDFADMQIHDILRGPQVAADGYSFFAFIPPFWVSSDSANSRNCRASSVNSFGSHRSR